MKFRNPFFHLIPVTSWHAEAIVKKRHADFIDTRYVYFDASTKTAAAKGLRTIIISQSFTTVVFKPVIEKHTYIKIPVWSAAFWFPQAIHGYMRKKGYIHADGN